MSKEVLEKAWKIAQTESSRKDIAQKQWFEICLKIAWNTIKSMFYHPLSLQGAYLSIFYVNFQSKMQNN